LLVPPRAAEAVGIGVHGGAGLVHEKGVVRPAEERLARQPVSRDPPMRLAENGSAYKKSAL